MKEKIFRTASRKLKIGVVLTVFFSIFIGFFNIGVLYLFGIPFFGLFLGITLIWLSKATGKIKILWSILPLPIILASFYLAFQLNKAESEMFLIPHNFRGNIVIFYEESCGQKPVYENGRRIYNFSESGVLITNFKKTKGILDQKFYFVDGDGNRTPIPKRDTRDFNFKGRLSKTENEPPRDEIAAFYSWAILSVSAKDHSYVVSSYRYFEKSEKESWKEIDRLSEKSKHLLDQCRRENNL